MPAWLITLLLWILRNCWQFLLGLGVTLALVIWIWWTFFRTHPDPSLERYVAKVEKHVSGTVLGVRRESLFHRPETVDLAYCGCPSLDQVYGDESLEALKKSLPVGSQCEIENVKKQGQIVWTMGAVNANMLQLSLGAVWCKSNAPSGWRAVEKEARKAGRGLWQYYAGPDRLKDLLHDTSEPEGVIRVEREQVDFGEEKEKP
jgi:endonuclease YncB( thermonuclease family)